jgi:hypothetical protein
MVITKKPAQEVTNDLRINFALGTLTVIFTIALLYLLNNLIFKSFHPDIEAIFAKVVPISIFPHDGFAPEPVERMQFQVSMLCCPIFICMFFSIFKKYKKVLVDKPKIALYINLSSLIAFFIFIFYLLSEKLAYVHSDPSGIQTTSYFFANNFLGKYDIIIGGLLYPLMAFACYYYGRSKTTLFKKLAFNFLSLAIVFIVLLDSIFYNVFHLAVLGWDRLMETNAVFYSMTQVLAGKFLLVNINSQYGLYAWFLLPLFKVIGLTTFKFSLVMGVLNAISFLFIYLGIKRVIKHICWR